MGFNSGFKGLRGITKFSRCFNIFIYFSTIFAGTPYDVLRHPNFPRKPCSGKIGLDKRQVQKSLFLGYGCMVVLEICIGPVRSIYSSYKACISAGIRVGGVVARLHHGSSLVGSLCDFICLYARMQWRLFH